MAIRKIHTVPNELPHARLYLDDIEEASRILREAVSIKFQNSDEQPRVVYKIGDLQLDSIDDLQTRGGSTEELEIEVGKRGSTELRFRGTLKPSIMLYSLDSDVQWSVYGKIESIFERRRMGMKNAIEGLPGWLKWLFWVLIAFVVPNAIWLIPNGTHIGHWLIGTSFITYLILVVTLGFTIYQPSKVFLVRSHESAIAATAARKGYVRDLVFLVLGALIGGVINHFLK